jgi:hypothetical protein
VVKTVCSQGLNKIRKLSGAGSDDFYKLKLV